MIPPPLTCLLVGHRTTGKTTLGRALALAHPSWSVIDLDEAITRQTRATPAQLIAQSLEGFRDIEAQTLASLVTQATHPITVIVVGAGCMKLPHGACVLWVERDGWTHTARVQREQVRPDLTIEQEFAWMRTQREPVWASRAHIRVRIHAGDPVHTACNDASQWIQWAASARHTPYALRSYFVPTTPTELVQAEHDARMFGLGGVEVRSDFFEARTLPQDHTGHRLYSLRHDDASWLMRAPTHKVRRYDIDITHLDAVLEQGILARTSPTEVLLSHHANTHDPGHIEHLVAMRQRCLDAHPHLTGVLGIKYAPKLDTWDQLNAFIHDTQTHPLRGIMTLLPQGHQWGWIRPWLLAQGNLTNYIPVGVATPDAPSPWDLQTWLPHLTKAPVSTFDALIGAPVAQSIGDAWHRHASLNEADDQRSYVKIPLSKEMSPKTLQSALRLLEHVDIRGVSITSPFKRLIPQVARPAHDELEAANTIALTSPTWRYTDTDAVGLRASLDHLEGQGIGPGTIAMIGRGGVSPAMRRALQGSAWTLAHHASAREGWGTEAPQQVTLVINACGDRDSAYHHPPHAQAWLDLHYTHVRTPPCDGLHLNGRLFFEAQARAQRAFWASPTHT